MYIKRILMLSTIISATGTILVNTANAQEAEAIKEEQKDEEIIIVTGTRLRGAIAPVGSSVISIGQDYIEKSSSLSLDKLLHETPQIFNLGVSEGSRGQSGGSGNIVYGNSVNLRGIGPYSTLVLLDGHRAVTNTRNVEPSILPTLAVERLEIVPDGASAIYGSDAVAGVVNMVLRRNVDGGKVLAQYGAGDDYDQNRLGLSWGTTWDSGQFFGAMESAHRSNLNGDDRDFYTAKQPNSDYRTDQCSPGNIIAGGVSYAIPAGGVTADNVDSLTAGSQNLCETQPGQDLLPEQDYVNAAFTFNQQLTDGIEFLADGFVAKRKFARYGAYDSASLTVPSSNAFFVDPSNSGLTSVTVPYSFSEDFPRNLQTGYSRSWEFTGGLKVDLPADWLLEVLGTVGETRETSNTFNGLDSRGALGAALASSDPATAFDAFGLHRTSDAVLNSINNQIFLVDNTSKFTGSEIRLDGPIMTLPGGDLLLAAGYEYQNIEYLPSLARGNPGTASTCAPCTVAGVSVLKRKVDSYYAELLVPIIGDDNAVNGIDSLQFKLALRNDKYSDVGSTTNPQFGIDWKPSADWRVRASYGESFRAPLITDLYGNSSAMYVELFPDPNDGGAPRIGVFQSGGNPALNPETAETKTLGFDWYPSAYPGSSFSMTYFDITYESQITAYLGDNNILNREASFDGTNIILRNADAAARIQGLLDSGMRVARGVLPDPVTLYVDGRPNNLGISETKGMDFQFAYNWSNSTGAYRFNFNGMYLLDYKVSSTPAGELVDRRNTIFNPNTLKLRASLNWELENVGAQLAINYVGGYDNNLAAPVQSVSSYTPIDLHTWIELGNGSEEGLTGGWVLSLDASNLLDEEPPYVDIAPTGNGSGGYDATLANPIGRVLSATISKSF